MSLRKITYITVFLLMGCSSSHFTSKETEKRNPPVKSDKEETTTKSINREDEYRDFPVLETEIGVASFYGDNFNGKKTANGEYYDKNELTAAHLNYPFNTIVRVINLLNNKSVVVRINDRRPDFNGRICDLSRKAAEMLNMVKKGITKVKLEVVKWGSD